MVSKLLLAGIVALPAIAVYQFSGSQTLPSWPRFYLSLKLDSWLPSIKRSTTPPATWVTETMLNAFVSNAIYTACDLELADILKDGPLPIAQIAAIAKTDLDRTDRLLKFLSVHGVFERVAPGVYKNGPISNVLRKDVPESVRPWVLHLRNEMIQSSTAWSGALRNSEKTPFQLAFSTTLNMWEYFALPENRKRLDNFDQAMKAYSKSAIEPIVSDYPWSNHQKGKIVDVGGGLGHLLAAILKVHPDLTGTLFDRNKSIENAEALWTAEYGVIKNRTTFVAGSFFDTVPSGGDVYILKHIIHDWSDAESISILKVVAKAMKDTKKNHPEKEPKVLVIEYLYDFPPKHSFIAKMDMNMVALNGKERSVDDYARLFEAAGLKLVRTYGIRGLFTPILAELA